MLSKGWRDGWGGAGRSGFDASTLRQLLYSSGSASAMLSRAGYAGVPTDERLCQVPRGASRERYAPTLHFMFKTKTWNV